ncbi:hypothetical protein DTL42_20025 [Bremerella cremea]|uniref:Uncharacterized protein n=1 Tax=Bremerella cremea TaxID=1031537 RepID=A0A368KQA7_9BACT|nr:hypothetical protein [Bremerella cremea]RCS42120.1 hypothetical protein DTL42_20025 [Bremerella cremea]
MSEPPVNPFASPEARVVAALVSQRMSLACLIPLWMWLPLSIAAAYFGTPADPISELIAMGINLLWLWIGTAIGALSYWPLRFATVLGLGLPLGVLTFLLGPYYLPAGAVIYILANLCLGALSWRSIPQGRLTILGGLSLGYVVGSILCLVGSLPLGIAGSLAGYLAAQKSLPREEV